MLIKSMFLLLCLALLPCWTAVAAGETSADHSSTATTQTQRNITGNFTGSITGPAKSNITTPHLADGSPTDTVAVQSYKKFLNGLDPKDVKTIRRALAEYDRQLASQDQPSRDRGFLLFRDFFYKVRDAQEESDHFLGSPRLSELSRKTPGDSRVTGLCARLRSHFADLSGDGPRLKALFENGLDIFQSEDYFYYDERPEFFDENFTRKVSPAIRDYLKIRRRDLAEGFHNDCMLLVPFNNIAGRVARWGSFLAHYPNSPLRAAADEYYHVYLGTLFMGLANSPVFDSGADDQVVATPELIKIYQSYPKQHPTLPSARIISDYLALLKQHDYHPTPEVDQFLQDHKIPILRGVQPFTR